MSCGQSGQHGNIYSIYISTINKILCKVLIKLFVNKFFEILNPTFFFLFSVFLTCPRLQKKLECFFFFYYYLNKKLYILYSIIRANMYIYIMYSDYKNIISSTRGKIIFIRKKYTYKRALLVCLRSSSRQILFRAKIFREEGAPACC